MPSFSAEQRCMLRSWLTFTNVLGSVDSKRVLHIATTKCNVQAIQQSATVLVVACNPRAHYERGIESAALRNSHSLQCQWQPRLTILSGSASMLRTRRLRGSAVVQHSPQNLIDSNNTSVSTVSRSAHRNSSTEGQTCINTKCGELFDIKDY